MSTPVSTYRVSCGLTTCSFLRLTAAPDGSPPRFIEYTTAATTETTTMAPPRDATTITRWDWDKMEEELDRAPGPDDREGEGDAEGRGLLCPSPDATVTWATVDTTTNPTLPKAPPPPAPPVLEVCSSAATARPDDPRMAVMSSRGRLPTVPVTVTSDVVTDARRERRLPVPGSSVQDTATVTSPKSTLEATAWAWATNWVEKAEVSKVDSAVAQSVFTRTTTCSS